MTRQKQNSTRMRMTKPTSLTRAQETKPEQKKGKAMANQKQAKSMTRELIANSIRAMEGEGNERKFILSFSSEEPYERWWGTEVLDHSDGAVDLTESMKSGVCYSTTTVTRSSV